MSNTKSTKRNTTKKAPTEALQSDKAQSGTGGTTTVAPKTKVATKPLQKATASKPTIASLQTELKDMTLAFEDRYKVASELGVEVLELKRELLESTKRFTTLYNTPLSVIIYQRFTDWLYNVTKNFRE
jgi:hypothetical protein